MREKLTLKNKTKIIGGDIKSATGMKRSPLDHLEKEVPVVEVPNRSAEKDSTTAPVKPWHERLMEISRNHRTVLPDGTSQYLDINLPELAPQDWSPEDIWQKEPRFSREQRYGKEKYRTWKKGVIGMFDLGTTPSNNEQASQFLDVVTQTVSEDEYEERQYIRDVKGVAEEQLRAFVVGTPEIANLFLSSIDYKSPESLKKLAVLLDVYQKLLQDTNAVFVSQSNVDQFKYYGASTEALEHELDVMKHSCFAEDLVPIKSAFLRGAQNVFSGAFGDEDANYLSFLFGKIFVDAVVEDRVDMVSESMLPFEISKSEVALISEDKSMLYLLPKGKDRGRGHQWSWAVSLADRIKETQQRRKMSLTKRDFLEGSSVGQNDFDYDEENEADLEYQLDEMLALAKPVTEFLPMDLNDEELLGDFITMCRSHLRGEIEKEFKIYLDELTICEQFYFLNYLKRTTIAKSDEMHSFTAMYGITGMRTFLSLERGAEDFGDKIVEFGQHEEVAGKVFAYYGELLDIAEKAEDITREKTECEGEMCIQLAAQVRENILNRAQKDLERAVRSDDLSQIEQLLSTYVTEAKEYVALLQEVGMSNLERVPATEIADYDQETMRGLLIQNYDTLYPGSEDQKFKLEIKNSLERAFKNSNSAFRILRDGEKVVSFNRFDMLETPSGEAVTYFGSFNADPAYSGIGGVMLEETIKEQLALGVPMMAHCDPEQPISRKYIEDGFIATGYYEVHGRPSFEIWRTEDIRDRLSTKSMSVEQLLTQKDSEIVVREKEEGETYPEIRDKKALTRSFVHNGTAYLVFETLPADLEEECTFERT